MKTYIAQRQINHDNQFYEAGDPLHLDEKAAAPLLMVGAVEEKQAEVVQEPINPGGDDKSKTDVQEQGDEIAQANTDADLKLENIDTAESKPATKPNKKAK